MVTSSSRNGHLPSAVFRNLFCHPPRQLRSTFSSETRRPHDADDTPVKLLTRVAYRTLLKQVKTCIVQTKAFPVNPILNGSHVLFGYCYENKLEIALLTSWHPTCKTYGLILPCEYVNYFVQT